MATTRIVAMPDLDLAALRKAAEGAHDDPRTYYASFGPVEILSLLDRIEELEEGCRQVAESTANSSCGWCRASADTLERLAK